MWTRVFRVSQTIKLFFFFFPSSTFALVNFFMGANQETCRGLDTFSQTYLNLTFVLGQAV